MKKLSAILALVLSMTCLFAACGGDGNENNGGGTGSGGEDKPAAAVNKEYFEWDDFEPNKITGFSD